MNKARVLSGLVFLLVVMGLCSAEHGGDVWNSDTLTDGFWGLNDQLADDGIEIGFGITSIYQADVKGGLSTHNKRGRFNGSYDLEMWLDMRKLLGFETGSVYMLVEGGWPDAEGIDVASLSSAFGVNADAVGNQGPVVKELYYEGPIFGEQFTVMIGKIDFTGVFDASAYADDECSQFLNAAFVDDPTIPFPDYSLGVVLTYDVSDSWYVMGGVADAQANGRESGFRTAFQDEDYFFYALETGVTAGNGTYRVGLWNDPQPKGSDNKRDDVGVYTSCDWMLHKENADPEDSQGLGGFFRYGYAPGNKNDVTNFFSAGFQYQGLFDGRDNDVFGLAYARGFFANTLTDYTEDYESVCEAYYNAQITPWFVFGPGIQYVANPGGSNSTKDAVIFGVRAQMTF